MKLTVLFLLINLIQLSASVYSQNTQFKLKGRNVSLKQAFNEIESQTDYRFAYRESFVDDDETMEANSKNMSVEDFLEEVVKKMGYGYLILEDNLVVITAKDDNFLVQEMTVKGKITDVNGTPLPGVNIIEKGTTNGAVTDLEGNYSISVSSSNAILTFSYVGYLDKDIEVNGQATINLEMEEDLVTLEEVVVVGYGMQRRKDVTGSIASINSEGIRENASSNLSQSLQGRIAGVEMTQVSSRPGAGMEIRIRGTRSLTASNDPLIVLDGIPFAGSLSDINPNDIKSADILKDASATAIYGSRGSNGVILISTFRGQGLSSTKPVVNLNSYYGVKNLLNEYPMMQRDEFVAWRAEAIANGASWQYGADEDPAINTNWQDLMFDKGMVTSQDISVSGAMDEGGYSIGLGYYDETTVLPGQEYTRYSLRGNFDKKVGQRIKVGMSTISSYALSDGEKSNILGGILSVTPTTNPYNDDGSIKTEPLAINNQDTYENPLKALSVGDRLKDERKNFASYNTIYGELQILDGLKYRMNLGLNFRQSNYGNFKGGNTPYNANDLSNAEIENELTTNWVVENLLYYDKTFSQIHKIGLVAMYSAEQTESNISNFYAEGVAADYLQYYNFGLINDNGEITIDPVKQKYYKRGLTSLMFRANYAFNNKYMATITMRSDGASVLAEGEKWHTYPAVSLGWNATNEDFLKSVSWLSFLKPRLGYGQTSNQAVEPYQTLGALATNYYNFGERNVSGYYVAKSPNVSLGWEYSSTWNYGLDFGILDNRVTGTFEYYTQKTKDVLVAQSLPRTSGVTDTYLTNIGETENKGFELSLNTSIIRDNNGLYWNLGFNIYANRNKIVSLASGQEYDKGNGWFVGHPIDAIYDFKKIGIWQLGEEDLVTQYEGSTGEVGMIKVEYTGDFNPDGTPTRQIGQGETLEDDDRQILGSVQPDFQGGFNTQLGYKGLELSVIGHFKKGGMLVSSIHSPTAYLNMNSGRRGQIKIDYWTEDNPTNAYPKPYGPEVRDHPKYGSTLAYFDATYVKISNITLAYNLKSEWLQKIKMERLRVYVTAQNPFILASDYFTETGLDPQPNTKSDDIYNQTVPPSNNSGVVKDRINVVGFNIPATRNYLVGINVSF